MSRASYYKRNAEKIKAKSKARREAHANDAEFIEKTRIQKKKYYDDNPEKVRESKTKYRKQNREKIKIRAASYRAENRMELRAKNKAYAQQNLEKIKEKSKAWRQANPKMQWGAHIKRSYGLSLEAYDSLLISQSGMCAICDTALDVKVCIDHCHDTGRIRGIVHFCCNFLEGFISKVSSKSGKSPSELGHAIEKYLRAYEDGVKAPSQEGPPGSA